MKRLREIVFWCHLSVGVICGLVILIMSVTGVLLTYERQIIAWADARTYRMAPPPQGAQRLTVDALIEKAREARPGSAPSTISLGSGADQPAAVGLGREGTLFIDPYTGEVLSDGARSVRNFFRAVTDMHRWLGARGEIRAVARAITGACNLGFLFLVISGFYLWWPRKWTWSQIRNVIWFKRGLPGKARDFNWHNTIGCWSAMPLFIIVLSAVVISFTWAGNLVYRLAGETPPAPRSPDRERQRAEAAPRENRPDGQLTLDQLWSLAQQQTSGWENLSMRLPDSSDASVTFTVYNGNGGQPQDRAQLALDRKSGDVVQWEPFSSNSTGRKIRSILRFAHTGEVLGVAGQTIAGLASAGGAVLMLTGLALTWRRFLAWAASRRNARARAVSEAAD